MTESVMAAATGLQPKGGREGQSDVSRSQAAEPHQSHDGAAAGAGVNWTANAAGLPYKRREVIGDATLYLGDCREVLPTLGKVDAVVTDPPYGIDEVKGRNSSRSCLAVSKDYGTDTWDSDPIDDSLLDAVRAAGRWQIIFGGNYYALPATPCWLVWDKLNGENDFADCELAWTNLRGAVRRIRYLWHGMLRANGESRGDHPTQKPVGVMSWALSHLPTGTRTVLDPFAGSGTTGVACVKAGLTFTGVEREPKYFEAMLRRIDEVYRQPRLFAEPAPKAQQLTMLDGAA